MIVKISWIFRLTCNYKMLIATISILMLLVKEYKASTVKCENGSGVCLSFNVSSLVPPIAIRRNDENLCAIFVKGGNITVFEINWSNKTLNCSLSTLEMSLCFGDCQPVDAGNFSLHNGTTPSYPSVQSLTLQIITPVSFVTLDPVSTLIMVTVGQQMNLTCETSYCFPSANITWHLDTSTENINSPIVTYNNLNGLVRTISLLQKSVDKSDNEKLVYCTATNIPGRNVNSSVHRVIAWYKPNVTSATPSPYIVHERKTATLECKVIDANPKTPITWKWFSERSPNYTLSTESVFEIPDIRRNRSGVYTCMAKNTAGWSPETTVDIDIQYRPDVLSTIQSPYRVHEGETATLECRVTDANPNTNLTWNWFHTNSPSKVFPSGSSFTILNIPRNRSGSYNCSATNSVGTSLSASIEVDVQYKPVILEKSSTVVNEGEKAILNREVSSNPLSNVSWFRGETLLINQLSVKNASYVIPSAKCTDTTNFTILASNIVESNVSAMVELIVNCKPQSSAKNITLGVTQITGLEFSTTVIAYPKPQYELQFENGTKASQMTGRIFAYSINNFTIYYNQTVVKQDDYGTYHLRVNNSFGETIIYVNVLPQQKPNMPILSEVVCEVTQAIVKWKSTFNGGDAQLFTAIALNGFYKESYSGPMADKGENEIHSATVQNLKPSTKYLFYVSANNSHGESSSKNFSCMTAEETRVNLQLVAGGAAAGGISLAIVIIVIVILLRKYTKHEKQTGKSQRFNNEVAENEEVNDDGMRDNILYVSAGPKVDEKPEAAVYASVNKNAPESNNNANVYAEVNKSGHNNAEGSLYSDVKPKRGLFKKDVSGKKDGKPKQKKGKKQKSKQDVADVYENSEDIAMSSKSDNVYSNTGQKDLKKEERGYKNKDGLLYVEVQFDAKTEKGNQTIHGEDEKTDYATVEFPMTASTHDG